MTDITGTHGRLHGDWSHLFGELVEQAANEITASARKLDESRARQFDEWLEAYLDQNHFDSRDFPLEFRLRAWLANHAETALSLILEYRVIMQQIKSLQRSDHETTS